MFGRNFQNQTSTQLFIQANCRDSSVEDIYYFFWSITNFPYLKPNRSIDTPSMSAFFCVCVVQCGQKPCNGPIIRPRNLHKVLLKARRFKHQLDCNFLSPSKYISAHIEMKNCFKLNILQNILSSFAMAVHNQSLKLLNSISIFRS